MIGFAKQTFLSEKKRKMAFFFLFSHLFRNFAAQKKRIPI